LQSCLDERQLLFLKRIASREILTQAIREKQLTLFNDTSHDIL